MTADRALINMLLKCVFAFFPSLGSIVLPHRRDKGKEIFRASWALRGLFDPPRALRRIGGLSPRCSRSASLGRSVYRLPEFVSRNTGNKDRLFLIYLPRISGRRYWFSLARIVRESFHVWTYPRGTGPRRCSRPKIGRWRCRRSENVLGININQSWYTGQSHQDWVNFIRDYLTVRIAWLHEPINGEQFDWQLHRLC